MERYCSTGQSPQRAVAPMEEEEEEEEGGIIMTKDNRSTQRKIFINVMLSTTNPIHTDLVQH